MFPSVTYSYQPLSGENSRSSLDDCHTCNYPPSRYTRREKNIATIFLTSLLLSNVLTWALSSNILHGFFSRDIAPTTPHANLARNVPVAFEAHTPYTDENETRANELWDQISIDAGMVAIPAEYAASHGLPVAQRFPWDRSRGIYLLNGHHNLHCIRAIYISLTEFWHGAPQSRSRAHVTHCADTLRQDILCNADDTPRYSTETRVPETGVGQVRMCRSWDRLEEWAARYNACYKFVNQTAGDFPVVQRFVYCPRGSPFKEEVEKVFGEVPDYEDS